MGIISLWIVHPSTGANSQKLTLHKRSQRKQMYIRQRENEICSQMCVCSLNTAMLIKRICFSKSRLSNTNFNKLRHSRHYDRCWRHKDKLNMIPHQMKQTCTLPTGKAQKQTTEYFFFKVKVF